MSYNICPLCGANLDPEEKCDCQKDSADKEEKEGGHTECQKS